METKEYLDFIKYSEVKIKTYLNIGAIALPIIVDISKIKEDKFYNTEDNAIYYKTIKSDSDFYIVDEQTPRSLFGKFKDLDLSYKILYNIYDFIDDTTIIDENGNTILKILNFPNRKSFAKYVIKSGVMSSRELVDKYNELLFYIEKARIIFIENMKKVLDFEKTFPHISLKKKDNDIPEHLLKNAQYTAGMIDMQSIIEFGTNVIYSENTGKTYEDWSWREKYVRKMYLDLKARTDEYIEKLKAKQMET